MNINNKHLETLESVATHIYLDGGRILFSTQLDEGNTKHVDFHNRLCIDGEINGEWMDSLSEKDKTTFSQYRKVAMAHDKDLTKIKIMLSLRHFA